MTDTAEVVGLLWYILCGPPGLLFDPSFGMIISYLICETTQAALIGLGVGFVVWLAGYIISCTLIRRYHEQR
jgi:Na+/proline symporter